MAVGWWAEVKSSAHVAMKKMATTANGGVQITSGIATTLPKLQTDISGWEDPQGIISATMQKLVSTASGGQEQTGVMASSMKAMISDASGDVNAVQSTIAASMLKMATSANGTQTQSGTIAATLLKMATSANGIQSQIGTIAATLKKLITDAVGSQASPPAFDSKSTLGTTFGQSLTLSHTTVAASTTVYALFAAETNAIVGATCDGVAMTQVATVRSGLSTIWKATVSSAGAHSISGNTISSGNQSGITGFSIAYTNVTTTGTAQTNSSTSNSASQSVTLGSAKIILQAFFALNGGASGASFSSPAGGTNRANGSQGQYSGLCVSDATATTTFTASGSPSFWTGYDAIALPLS